LYLCTNRIGPAYEGLELGIGDGLLFKAIAETTGSSVDQLKKAMEKEGDLAIVAEKRKMNQGMLFKPKALTIPKVFSEFIKIAKSTGSASMTKKVGHIKALLAAGSGHEPRYIIRSLQGALRIGCSEITVVASLARAIAAQNSKLKDSSKVKEADVEHVLEILKRVHSEVPNWEIIIPKFLEFGMDNLLDHCHLTPGVPIKAMLAKPTKGISEILERLKSFVFTLEFKYDGERAQVALSCQILVS
jgi:DNA ligase-1